MKKLLLAAAVAIGLAVPARAFPQYQYVQISTDTTYTPPLQKGAINISSATIAGPLITTGTVQINGNITTPLTIKSSMTVTGNGEIDGVFKATGTVQLGSSGSSVQISSNVVMPGTTIYSGGTYSVVTDSASIIQLNNQIMHYRRPRLMYVSGTEVDIESGTVVSGSSITIIFPDGAVYNSTGTETSQAVINSTANWGNGGLKGGMAPNENQTNNTWEGFYLVKSSATGDTTHMVVVISSFMPTPSNYTAINTKFCGSGANCWMYVGLWPYGDNISSPGVFPKGMMAGNLVCLYNLGNATNNARGIRLAATGSATTLTWTYASGSLISSNQIPPQVTVGNMSVTSGASSSVALTDSGGNFSYLTVTTGAGVQTIPGTGVVLTQGLKSAASGAVAMDLLLTCYQDNYLGVGSNP